MTPSHNTSQFTALLFTLLWFIARVASDNPECIYEVKQSSGEMQSPGYPYNSGANISCTYKLTLGKPGDLAYFFFDDFYLVEGDSFSINNTGKEIQSLTGIKVPFLLIMHATSTIIYKAGNSTSVRKFHSIYNVEDCTIYLKGKFDLLLSPIYPPNVNTPTIAKCKWIIVSPPDNHYYIALSFSEFKVGKNQVLIYNGLKEKSLLANFTGISLPPDVIATEPQMTIRFNFDISEKNISFQSEFNAVVIECAETINVTNKLTIKPRVLDNFMDFFCIWIVKAEGNVSLLMNLRNLTLNNLDDSLIINDGPGRFSKNIALYTQGMTGIPNLMTSGGVMYISLSARKNVVPSTFTLDIEVQVNGGRYRDNGNFSFIPENENETVIFDLEVQPDKQVEATILTKLVGNNKVNFYGLLPNKTRLPLTTFTSNDTMFPVFSISNQMVVEALNFEKNDTFQGRFLGIPKGCDEFSHLKTGSYQLTDSLQSNCTWLVKPESIVSKEDVISLTFHSLNLGNKGDLRIYKGLAGTKEDLVIAFNSSIQYYPSVILPLANGVRVDTYLDKSAENLPCIMTAFYEVLPGCSSSNNLTSGTSMLLQSPGYPTRYTLNAYCKWSLQVPTNLSFALHFSDVDLYPLDVVLIYSSRNGSLELLYNISEKGLPSDMLVFENITVEWNSSVSNTRPQMVRGFSLNVKVLDCGRNITQSKGEFDIPGEEIVKLSQEVKCIWIIDVGSKNLKTGEVYIVDFQINAASGSNSTGTSLKVIDGGSVSDTLLETANSTSFLSRTNKILIEYTSNVKQVPKPSYKLTFSTKGCDKAHQCKNSLCMHDSWRCNGENNCGDYSDEDNCNSPPSSGGGVSTTLAVILTLIGLICGIALTMLAPFAIQKIRRYKQRYNDFHTLPDD